MAGAHADRPPWAVSLLKRGGELEPVAAMESCMVDDVRTKYGTNDGVRLKRSPDRCSGAPGEMV